MRYLRYTLVAILLASLWFVVAFYGGLVGWWLSANAPKDDNEAFFHYASETIDKGNNGDLAFVMIDNGKVYNSVYRGAENQPDETTSFPVASLSKWITAYGVMTLLQERNISPDTPVAELIERWQLPESGFDNSKVTVARLLSHTAGLTDGLGFADLPAEETLPPLLASLNNPKASSGEDVKISVGIEPGSEWKYSGGGYLLLQLLVEDVSGQPFAEYMQQHIFSPIGMTSSGYDYLANQQNAATMYDEQGAPAPYYQYASAGATGLSSSAADLIRFVQANLPTGSSAPLEFDNVDAMRAPHGHKMGADIWGLGTMLYAPTASGSFVYGHDGSNEPAINSAVRINPDNGDALIVLASGNKLLASQLGYEWTLWQTGYPDFLFLDKALDSAVLPFAVGLFVLIAILVIVFVRRKSPR
ncbi:serine hydrolase domain-containing protein [Teredinibacter turnerae]|uniref:serine hydrolase domain-containing protein n=1 Tax=Teredinibacter turnerae TaxID=2426 RepID=UPI00035D00F6|nr:serine hydrolase domain-containing protein [Teredinibacter turnerae]